ncbi:MAG: helix-turn-helix transcriptional regulator [Chitinophaga sp.]|uniref:AraC family transcriptional regulator n=1 Tax=Chitinophaga sp. TaxID=1869181 RepID=UPI0025B906CA|nr:AraC family transcriptional regulator [Chitinophaga sp.]MBV8253296.1 helix-turn-helix transcriptional regulator [Chitinophaga sp.]
MMRENIFQPFVIREMNTDHCPVIPHYHNYFELVYILAGTGTQVVNENRFAYRAGHLFLLTPEDEHHFEVHATTQFFFLRFNAIFIRQVMNERKEWVKRMEFILDHAGHAPGCILHQDKDGAIAHHLIQALREENQRESLYKQEVMEQLVNTLITLVARNVAARLPAEIPNNNDRTLQEIIRHIQAHIYEPEMLKADKIAAAVGVSVNYLGRYFKKHAGENMQDYILRYKLKLVETRLLHSNMRINEIAWELNFADESHLTRLFKKHNGMNPSAFRKKALMTA